MICISKLMYNLSFVSIYNDKTLVLLLYEAFLLL